MHRTTADTPEVFSETAGEQGPHERRPRNRTHDTPPRTIRGMRTTSGATLSLLGGLACLAATAVAQAQCPPGSTKISDSERRYCDLGRSFTLEACARECQSLGASLPCPDAAENDFVASLRQDRKEEDNIWLGLYQAPDASSKSAGWDSWAGASCSSPYRKWAQNEPNDFGCVNENAGVISTKHSRSAEWFDVPASSKASCICEMGEALAQGYLDEAIPELMRASRGGIDDCDFEYEWSEWAQWLEHFDKDGMPGKDAAVLTLSLLLGFSVVVNMLLVVALCCCGLCKRNNGKGCACNGANGITIIHHNPQGPHHRPSAANANLQYVRNLFEVPSTSESTYSVPAANVAPAVEVPNAPNAPAFDASDEKKGVLAKRVYPVAWAPAHEGDA